MLVHSILVSQAITKPSFGSSLATTNELYPVKTPISNVFFAFSIFVNIDNKAPCSGEICICASFSVKVSSLSCLKISSSLNETSNIYFLSSLLSPIVLLDIKLSLH